MNFELMKQKFRRTSSKHTVGFQRASIFAARTRLELGKIRLEWLGSCSEKKVNEPSRAELEPSLYEKLASQTIFLYHSRIFPQPIYDYLSPLQNEENKVF